ncbi:hypothetical protein CC78DRAFT_573499 [Lojkania enalia]|uniref:Uncharacterized protein n=1 Tax=Lojkania enalia TaxID=147567 RepID=A0A9P4ND69_9PLEO|nr:hypothetical protein CC78DRAFT_573499 [Didymosphaeria enalia]
MAGGRRWQAWGPWEITTAAAESGNEAQHEYIVEGDAMHLKGDASARNNREHGVGCVGLVGYRISQGGQPLLARSSVVRARCPKRWEAGDGKTAQLRRKKSARAPVQTVTSPLVCPSERICLFKTAATVVGGVLFGEPCTRGQPPGFLLSQPLPRHLAPLARRGPTPSSIVQYRAGFRLPHYIRHPPTALQDSGSFTATSLYQLRPGLQL